MQHLTQKPARSFVPATEGASVFTKSPNPARGDLGFYPGSSGGNYVVPEQRVVRALDAATGAKKWERWEHSLRIGMESLSIGYSGLLATRGGLVFGESEGFAFAIDSATGRELWRVFLGGETYAAPISFTVDGHQVILVSAGRALFYVRIVVDRCLLLGPYSTRDRTTRIHHSHHQPHYVKNPAKMLIAGIGCLKHTLTPTTCTRSFPLE